MDKRRETVPRRNDSFTFVESNEPVTFDWFKQKIKLLNDYESEEGKNDALMLIYKKIKENE